MHRIFPANKIASVGEPELFECVDDWLGKARLASEWESLRIQIDGYAPGMGAGVAGHPANGALVVDAAIFLDIRLMDYIPIGKALYFLERRYEVVDRQAVAPGMRDGDLAVFHGVGQLEGDDVFGLKIRVVKLSENGADFIQSVGDFFQHGTTSLNRPSPRNWFWIWEKLSRHPRQGL